ncbi:NAD(P)H-binding protein [Streptomyces sp. NBC_01005]|uniref:NAD(P)H-binding protein n=1 Tax=unclassified Streptomyces TaxID=2593676 RepID=UPI002E378E62|nr:NAD(P)H-binding protein [Streptomyces sp. NBC_01362]WSW03018.1 NAD(P)H-binding protein [Streptomyces sp. NBC_01005]WTC92525.1 NAD(P)H-binding protein [Streptomyces sp. NBC_01650]
MTQILVLGATGKTGSRIVPRLKSHGHSVRSASRSTETRFDWADRSTWDRALAGAEAVYFVPTETLGLPERAELVDRAKAAGVRRIVQLSVRGLDADGGIPETEAAVRESGLEWTILRPCWFSQDFSAPDFFLPAVLGGELATPAGDGREPFVDVEDIADVAVAALTDDGHAGRAYELSGPRALTFTEALAVIGTAIGRELHHRHQDPAAYVAAQVAAGHHAVDAEAVAAFLDGIRRGEDDYISTGVQEALGRAPRSFEDYVRTAAPTGVWNP